jgi:hypothetical protein
MNTLRRSHPLVKAAAIILVVTVVLFVSLFAYRMATGRSLGLRSFAGSPVRFTKSLIKAVMDRQSVRETSQGKLSNVIFLHHSVGRNLIEQGNLRQEFSAAGYQFWDHDYNDTGLTDFNGNPAGYSYNIPGDNTDVDGLARIFQQKVFPLPVNTLSGLLQHEVIVFKSCFPVNNIVSDEQLDQYKSYYRSIRATVDRYPNKVFIVLTSPPLNPSETSPEIAARARVFASWLKSEEFLSGHPNLFTFDFYNLLAEDNPNKPDFNMLRQDYRDGADSHPNQKANRVIGPLLVDFVNQAVQEYRAKPGA